MQIYEDGSRRMYRHTARANPRSRGHGQILKIANVNNGIIAQVCRRLLEIELWFGWELD